MPAYPIHPFAELTPRPTDAEINALRVSIRERGTLDVPVVIFRGELLDGRARQAAWMAEHGDVDHMPTRQFDGIDSEASALVCALNVHRRMLSTSQRAFILAEVYRLNPAKRGRPARNEITPRVEHFVSEARVGQSTVSEALRALKVLPALFPFGRDGTLTVAKALEIAECWSPEDQHRALDELRHGRQPTPLPVRIEVDVVKQSREPLHLCLADDPPSPTPPNAAGPKAPEGAQAPGTTPLSSPARENCKSLRQVLDASTPNEYVRGIEAAACLLDEASRTAELPRLAAFARELASRVRLLKRRQVH